MTDYAFPDFIATRRETIFSRSSLLAASSSSRDKCGAKTSSRGIITRGKLRPGFTLLEVLTALLIIAIVLPSVMYGIDLGTRMADMTRHRTEATALAETELNELVATGDWQTGALSGDFGDEGPGYTWQATVQSWDDPNLQQIDMVVSWVAHGESSSVTLSTMVYTGGGTSEE